MAIAVPQKSIVLFRSNLQRGDLVRIATHQILARYMTNMSPWIFLGFDGESDKIS